MRRLIEAKLVLVSFLENTLTMTSKAGQSLFLISFIENGQPEIARKKAQVQHKAMQNVKSYAGYYSNSFCWYFPSKTNPSTDPLLIWMTGGLGSASFFALFIENGPFIINKNREVELREYSWHCNHNIIFIDNPIGTGFSFTENENSYARNQTQIGQDVLTTLLRFFEIFPEMRNNVFYVTGELYAGKYVPAVSHAIMITTSKGKLKLIRKQLK